MRLLLHPDLRDIGGYSIRGSCERTKRHGLLISIDLSIIDFNWKIYRALWTMYHELAHAILIKLHVPDSIQIRTLDHLDQWLRYSWRSS